MLLTGVERYPIVIYTHVWRHATDGKMVSRTDTVLCSTLSTSSSTTTYIVDTVCIIPDCDLACLVVQGGAKMWDPLV